MKLFFLKMKSSKHLMHFENIIPAMKSSIFARYEPFATINLKGSHQEPGCKRIADNCYDQANIFQGPDAE